MREHPTAETKPLDDAGLMKAALQWLEAVVRRELRRAQLLAGGRKTFDEFAGMYVSDQEIAEYLHAGRSNEAGVSPVEDAEFVGLSENASALRTLIDQEVVRADGAGRPLRLPRLARAFRLRDKEARALVCCIAPDLDVRFQRYFAYIQNDVSMRRPTVQLLARLCDVGDDPTEIRRLFGPHGALMAHRLLSARSGAGQADTFAGRQLRAADAVLAFLLGFDHLDENLAAFTVLRPSQELTGTIGYLRHHRDVLAQLAAVDWIGGEIHVFVGGPEGCGKDDLIHAAAHAEQRRVVEISCRALADLRPAAEVLPALARDLRMHDAVLHIRDCGELEGESGGVRQNASLLRALLSLCQGQPVALSGTGAGAAIKHELPGVLLTFSLPYPTTAERREMWETHLAVPHRDLVSLDDVASRFRLTPRQIRSAARSFTATATARNGSTSVAQELYRCCRAESAQRVLEYVRQVRTKYTWGDLVLPADTLSQLREICGRIQHRNLVFNTWGFDRGLSMGSGLNVMFAGPSGTGKTTCVEILAGETGLELLKIDLSCVVSKYVGETERNLSRIFDNAKNCILFFDEADALFGKRSEVKDAHDRYANIEINYLLQKMDEYSGFVILATNLEGNMDPAFTRRLNYVVGFPLPREEHRQAIWRKAFPVQTPLARDMNFDFLARRFNLTGGNIRNIALNSAFLAAEGGRAVDMNHVIWATKREYQKMGKLCSSSEFGQYYDLVREVAS